MGAKMVDFGGWDMPLFYSGILEEHRAVRAAVGVFDVSHMGEIEIRGPEAGRLVHFLTTNDPGRLAAGQAQYSALLYPHGGIIDDIVVHKLAENDFFLCVNAANQEKDFEHLRSANRFEAAVENAGARWAQVAIQGPRALATARKLTSADIGSLRRYGFAAAEFAGVPARVARTGYTGEDGFEAYVAPECAEAVWTATLEAGAEFGVQPCGLGARNTLRLEAALALYGHELDASISPLEARLDRFVNFGKGDFLGRQALLKQQAAGLRRKLAGFEMRGRGIAREGYAVLVDGRPAGWVTSGSPAPALNKNIGLCYLPVEHARPGQPVQIAVRGQPVEAAIVATPFYQRASH
jgi:aminomethyltransferase